MTTVDLALLREQRAWHPEAVVEAARARRRPSGRPDDGRLMLIAADHTARGVVAVGGNQDAMANRGELLSRLVAALARPGVDGVLGTPDIIEDLLLLGALDGKVVIGSMNRGGLAGAAFELDDRFTGYDAESIAAMGFEGGKTLTRIDLSDPASLPTLEATANAVNALADRGLMAMVEPFLSTRTEGILQNVLTPEAVVKSIVIASGLGRTSRHTWLKLPVVDDMERVMAATTLPALLLGGDPSGPIDEYYARWRNTLSIPGVRGLVVGRTLLFPQDDDVEAAVDTAAAMVHPALEGASA
jgi:DhnA family fructose-bisphosphate aldolase class Ia